MTFTLPRNLRSRKPQAGRLLLEIGGTRYSLRPVACHAQIGKRAFRLLKDDGTVYDVVQTPYGAECDCPDFIFRRDGLDPDGCKHVQALVSVGMIPAHRAN
ncbi:MAG: hypothetical protein JWN86_809 [Planctomycetota bacterium]|nr:hypothetical protein [Planctomycetota bacterium]